MSDVYAELAELGVATVFEASGRRGLIDALGVAAVLVDAAVRDVDELRELGLPVWAR